MGSWVDQLIEQQQQQQQQVADKTEAVVNQQPPSICPFKNMIVAKTKLDIIATILLVILLFILIIKNVK